MRSHPTAGQATLEYIAAVALLAALLLVAAPAVGAPDLARRVADAVEHGLCVVGGDVCSKGDARRAASTLSTEVRSDGCGRGRDRLQRRAGREVAVDRHAELRRDRHDRRTGGGTAGVAGGSARLGASLGPVKFEAGAEGALRARVLGGRGWVLPDRASANRFLEHAAVHSFTGWPPTWRSLELGLEAAGRPAVRRERRAR